MDEEEDVFDFNLTEEELEVEDDVFDFQLTEDELE